MVNFPTQISDCDYVSPTLLDLFLPSDASICSAMAFFPLGDFDHIVVSVSIDFLLNSKQDASFPCIAYDYSCPYWGGHRDHLRDVPWEDIFKLSASAASEFCESVHLIVRPDSSVVKSVCTVSTRSWVRIPLGPTFYIESKNLSSK